MAEVQATGAQEPSMEEILASIRKIISDDGTKKEDEPVAAVTEATAVAATLPAAANASADVLELTQMVADDGSIVDVNAPEPAALTLSDPEPEVKTMAPPVDIKFDDPLISESAASAAKSALSTLASTLETERMAMTAAMPIGDGTRTLESMVTEIMRPMIKQWLDQNLSGVVERAVQKEIQRISRRITD
jgi:uncharacterized protein